MDRAPQPVLLEVSLDDAFEKEAHRMARPGIREHQLIERQQRFDAREGRRGRSAGDYILAGPHGGIDDTSAARLAGNEPYPSDGGLVPAPDALTVFWVEPYYSPPLPNRASP